MLGMSFFDICASVAMGLSHWPLPKDTYYFNFGPEGVENIRHVLCRGSFSYLDLLLALFYNGALCVFYAATIALSVDGAS
jgi:hypothetical protein